MLIQRAGTGTLPPPGFTTPPWKALAEQWSKLPAPSTPFVDLGPEMLVMGHDDAEPDDLLPGMSNVEDIRNHEFGWDNESPKRQVKVASFRIEWRPITNGEFYTFWKKGGDEGRDLPASWVLVSGEVCVSCAQQFKVLEWKFGLTLDFLHINFV